MCWTELVNDLNKVIRDACSNYEILIYAIKNLYSMYQALEEYYKIKELGKEYI